MDDPLFESALMMRTLSSQPGTLDRRSRWCQSVLRAAARIPFLPEPRAYSLTVSHERKFLWFRVPKNGTRTVLNHFRSAGVSLDVAERPYRLYYAPALYRDYLKFAFVRNPWDRLVSCWWDKIVRKKGVLFEFEPGQVERMMRFENFVDYVSTLDITRCNYHLRSQREMIDVNGVDYLGRMETFADDFRHVCQALGVPCDTIVQKNRSQHREGYRKYYTRELRDKVATIYQTDVQVFGYEY